MKNIRIQPENFDILISVGNLLLQRWLMKKKRFGCGFQYLETYSNFVSQQGKNGF